VIRKISADEKMNFLSLSEKTMNTGIKSHAKCFVMQASAVKNPKAGCFLWKKSADRHTRHAKSDSASILYEKKRKSAFEPKNKTEKNAVVSSKKVPASRYIETRESK